MPQVRPTFNAFASAAVIDEIFGPKSAIREVVARLVTCTRTLGGRWLEFRSESTPPGESDLQIMTWDEADGVYRQWVFDSDGYRHAAEGRWDDASATLTWTGRSDVGPFVIVDRWMSPDRLEWTLEGRDASGRIVRTISGTLRRAAPEHGAMPRTGPKPVAKSRGNA